MSDPVHPVSDPAVPARPICLARWGLAITVVVLGAWFAGAAPRWRNHAAAVDRIRQTGAPMVLVIHPRLAAPADPPIVPAEVKSWSEARILPRATGYVRSWSADLGARVKAGDVLAEIESPEIEQELARARADLAHADAATVLAQSTALRWRDLLKSASVSDQETAEKIADLALKQAAAESARADVRRLEQLIGFTHVTAPFDGTVTIRNLDIGELVSAGSTRELFHLADTRRLRVFVHVPQPFAEHLAIGQTVEVLPGDTSQLRIPARVARTAGQLEPATRTLLIELELDNASGALLAGTFARVCFPNAQGDPILTVPANTLILHAEGPQVGVVRPDKTVELRRITLGRDRGPVFEVRAGITADDWVILNPADSLHGGQKVAVRESGAPATATAKP